MAAAAANLPVAAVSGMQRQHRTLQPITAHVRAPEVCLTKFVRVRAAVNFIPTPALESPSDTILKAQSRKDPAHPRALADMRAT